MDSFKQGLIIKYWKVSKSNIITCIAFGGHIQYLSSFLIAGDIWERHYPLKQGHSISTLFMYSFQKTSAVADFHMAFPSLVLVTPCYPHHSSILYPTYPSLLAYFLSRQRGQQNTGEKERPGGFENNHRAANSQFYFCSCSLCPPGSLLGSTALTAYH